MGMLKVSAAISMDTSVARMSPEKPNSRPEANHAVASTLRTGTPSSAVLSRSSASARIAVPSLLRFRKIDVPATSTMGKIIAIACVQLMRSQPLTYCHVVGGQLQRADVGGPAPLHDAQQQQGEAQRGAGFDQRIAVGQRWAQEPAERQGENAAQQHRQRRTTSHWFQPWSMSVNATSAHSAPTAP